uniref:Transmembrane protein n=1 Tax=Rhabditophanes sp. KR3021 TaxID=114890 RepID=A0AC35TVB2_9BILA
MDGKLNHGNRLFFKTEAVILDVHYDLDIAIVVFRYGSITWESSNINVTSILTSTFVIAFSLSSCLPNFQPSITDALQNDAFSH